MACHRRRRSPSCTYPAPPRGLFPRNSPASSFLPCAGLATNDTAATKKGATSAERKERGLLPQGKIPAGAQLYYVGRCPCCGDRWLSAQDAKQCNATNEHGKTEGFEKKKLTLDRSAISANGEKAGDMKEP